ncbi:MAG: Enoyl-CoA hydratase/isomerase [Firmicutes bacterium]|nr:Enoyl-CoA hydratase/isomerase [Bacillota bacterium]
MPLLLSETGDGVTLLTLNRPEALNAMSVKLFEELTPELERIASRRDVRAVIITGAGERAFCAGNDLKERRDMNPEQKWAQSRMGWRVNQLLMRMPQPSIAAIGGWCLGGGFELALFCDMRVAAEDAVFGWPEMTLGAYPGAGAGVILPRLIGRARAKDLFFTARRVDAREALQIGLVEWVVPRSELLDRAYAIAEQIKTTSPLGVAAVKQLINVGADLSFDAAGALNDALRRPLEATRDYAEGISAHFEKRRPVFRGE